MSGKITLLGTGTCQIQKDRMASSVLIEMGDLKVIYDLGPGVTHRLIETGLQQNNIRHIIFSHFHPDHVSDIVPFLQAACWSRIDSRDAHLNIYGPLGTKDLIAKLLDVFGSEALSSDKFQIKVHELHDGKFKIEGQEFTWTYLPPVNNHGIKFTWNNKTCGITGDSDLHDREVQFLKNADIAIVDAGHIDDAQIVDLAISSQAKKMICSHLYRELDEENLNTKAQKAGYAGRIIVGKDLMSFDLE